MPKETPEQITRWIAEEWGRCFANVVESMSDQKPTVTCTTANASFEPAEGAFIAEQELSLGPEYAIRIAVPELIWREVGTLVLRAAGIEEVGRDDARGTFHEVLSQTFSSVAQAIGSRIGQEVTCGPSVDKDVLPEGATGLSLSISLLTSEVADYPVFLAPTPELVEHFGEPPASTTSAPSPATEHAAGLPTSSLSKTFDLLLGVHLPVAVSFGKTSLMVKEVLKLSTGSIIELNRTVTEPVDIIVNNCIIAKGDVVVVAGNYGVRVREIVSKEQRYQTGVRPAMTHRAD